MTSIFDRAKTAYRDCISDLTVMGDAVATIQAKQGKKFDTRILLNQFDVLLQYSLLQIALADGTLANEEACFIRDLAENSDLTELLKKLGYDNASWQTIYNTEESKLSSILKSIEQDVMNLSKDIVSVFAGYDAANPHDYFADLKNNIAIIIAATCQADGKSEACELNEVCLIIKVMAQIKMLKNKM